MRILIPTGVYFLLLFILLLTAFQSTAQKTWDRGGGTNINWSNPLNWSDDVIPTATDDVELSLSDGADVTVVVDIPDAKCKSLTLSKNINGGTNRFTVLLRFNAGGQLTVSGLVNMIGNGKRLGALDMDAGGKLICAGFSIDGNNPAASQSLNSGTIELNGTTTLPTAVTNTKFGTFNNLIINGGATTLGQNLTIKGNLTVLAGVLNESTLTINRNPTGGTLQVNDSATLKVGGINNFPVGFSTTILGTASTVEYNGDIQTVSVQNYGNLTLNGAGAKTMTGVSSVRNEFTIGGSARTTDVNTPMTIGRNVSIGTGSTFDPGTTGLTHNVVGNWARNGTFIPNSGTINFNGYEPQFIGASNFNNITFNNAGVKLATGNLAITGSVTINHNFNAGLGTHTVSGNWVNNGFFNPNSSTIVFNGAGAQEISGVPVSPQAFHNLRMEQGAGGTLNLFTPVTIARQAGFGSGIINSTSGNLLTFTADADIDPGFLPKNTSFVNGPVQKIVKTGFIFPVGKNGKYVPISVSNSSDGDNAFTAEYFVGSAHELGAVDKANGLQQVSACEYWSLVQNAGAGRVHVKLEWSDNNACPGDNYIADAESMVVAYLKGSAWSDFGPGNGQLGDYSGNASKGSVRWFNVLNYGYFTLGTTSLLNALPVVFANIAAAQREGDIVVSFSNLTEEKVASYTIERSANGNDFQNIGILQPQLNNNSRADYTFVDHAPLNGDNFYRIRAVETTGKSIYSAVVRMWAAGMAAGMVVYPNPARINSTLSMQLGNLPAGKYRLRVFNQHGQAVHTAQFNHAGGAVSTPLSTSGLSAGQYILELNGTQKITRTFLLQ